MALPDILSWATATGAVAEPPAGQKVSGWLAKQKPPATWFNWLFNKLGLWTAYLHADISTGREAGQQYRYSAARNFRLLLTPAFGGFVPLSGSPASPTVDSEGLRSASSGTEAQVYLPLLPLPRQTDGAILTVASIGATYKSNAAGGTIKVQIIELDQPNASGPVAVGTELSISAGTSGAWQEATPQAQTGVTIKPDCSYAVRIKITPAATAADLQIATVVLNTTKARVE